MARPPSPERHPRDLSWSQLAAAHWQQYAATLALFVLLEVVDPWEPHPHFIYHGSDAEYWRYSKPRMPDFIPIWLVPLLALVLPAVVMLGAHLAGRVGRTHTHHACLMLLSCVALTGLLGNLLKSQVGRPRPDFMSRCWPSGGIPVWSRDGAPQCEEGVPHAVLKTGMRSFPSVHASWCAAGLGFLSLWLLGVLGCFAGPGPQPAQLVLALAPLAGAGWVGITRVRIHRHNTEDVLGGQLLGLSLAFLFYRQTFASPFSEHAGRLNEDVMPERGSGSGRVAGEAAGHQMEGEEAESGSEPLLP